MKPLLGFIVLTGPLFLIILWVPVCIWLAVWMIRKTIKRKNLPLKIAGGLAVFLFALFLPVTDMVVDRIYLKHLCEAEAITTVLSSVSLPAEFKNSDGKQILIDSYGKVDYRLLGKFFNWDIEDQIYSNNLTKIHKRTWKFVDKRNHKILAEKISFLSDGGWIENISPAPGRGADCQSIEISKYGEDEYFRHVEAQQRNLLSRIFYDLGERHGNNN